jgi:dihydrofolate synthase/folylpolyglutamate synthase
VEDVVGARHAEVERIAPKAGTTPHFQLRNAALASAAVEALLDDSAEGPVEFPAVPGRAEVLDGDPRQIFDAAHNPDGAQALAAVLPSRAQGHEVVCSRS